MRESLEKFQAAERETLKKADVWKAAEALQTGAANPETTQPAVTSSPRP